MGSKPVWPTERVPRQPGQLERDTLSQEKKKSGRKLKNSQLVYYTVLF